MSWNRVVNNAQNALDKNEIWFSFKNGNRYRVLSVQEDTIKIQKLNSRTKTSVELKQRMIESAIAILCRGPISRGKLFPDAVVKECALVKLLHPNVSWDSGTDEISWKD